MLRCIKDIVMILHCPPDVAGLGLYIVIKTLLLLSPWFGLLVHFSTYVIARILKLVILIHTLHIHLFIVLFIKRISCALICLNDSVLLLLQLFGRPLHFILITVSKTTLTAIITYSSTRLLAAFPRCLTTLFFPQLILPPIALYLLSYTHIRQLALPRNF